MFFLCERREKRAQGASLAGGVRGVLRRIGKTGARNNHGYALEFTEPQVRRQGQVPFALASLGSATGGNMSKKFINNPANVVNEMLEVGMARERYRKSRGQGMHKI